MTTNRDREAFESWMHARYDPIVLRRSVVNQSYYDREIERWWQAWQASRATAFETDPRTTVERVYFSPLSGAFAITKDGKEWRLSEREIADALNRK